MCYSVLIKLIFMRQTFDVVIDVFKFYESVLAQDVY